MMGAQIVQVVQGSPEWHAHRNRYRNASETAIVMGDSPWQTPYQLWELRTGRRQLEINAAMARGSMLEPQARAAYEALTGHVMQPLVLIDGEYSASLDGMAFDGSLIVEIKCPYRGRQSSLWKAIEAGTVPDHYRWQVEHQLMVSGASMAHLFVFDGNNGRLIEIALHRERWRAIQETWDAFIEYIETDTPPPLTDRDKVIRKDAEWQAAAAMYLELKREADRVAGLLDGAKERLVNLASHPSESGSGVAVTRFWKQGAVDYKRIAALQGLDLELYRTKSREEVRVTVNK